MSRSVPFCEMVRASGAGEVWIHTTDEAKLRQFGWRCTNNENLYKNASLMGNWSEERFDIKYRKGQETLPSQYGHYFDSINNSSYNTVPRSKDPEILKNLKSRHSHAFPGHQPEFDSDYMKDIYNSWKTTQRADYMDPKLRRSPIIVNRRMNLTSASACSCNGHLPPRE